MKKPPFFLLLLFFSQVFFGQNEKTMGGCNSYLSNIPSHIHCKNGCNDTLDLCVLDTIILHFSVGCLPSTPSIKHVQWFRNGIALPNDTLIKCNVTATGKYSCQWTYIVPNILFTTGGGIGSINIICSTNKFDTLIKTIVDTINPTIKFYPNPSHGYFTIEIPSTEPQIIELIDLKGLILFSQTINIKTDFDFSNFDSGIYVLSINSSNSKKKVYKKLIIDK